MIDSSPRFPNQPPMRVVQVRWLTALGPVCYLVGATIDALELGPKQGVVGSLLVLLALLGLLVGLYRTGIARIFQEHARFLDEAERLIRAQVLARAYQVFTVVIVIGVVAADIGIRKLEWSIEPASGLLTLVAGAVIVFAMSLPTALLAWRLPADEPGEA